MPRSGMDDAVPQRSPAASVKELERRRLAEALRANLHRRKVQKCARLGHETARDELGEQAK